MGSPIYTGTLSDQFGRFFYKVKSECGWINGFASFIGNDGSGASIPVFHEFNDDRLDHLEQSMHKGSLSSLELRDAFELMRWDPSVS